MMNTPNTPQNEEATAQMKDMPVLNIQDLYQDLLNKLDSLKAATKDGMNLDLQSKKDLYKRVLTETAVTPIEQWTETRRSAMLQVFSNAPSVVKSIQNYQSQMESFVRNN